MQVGASTPVVSSCDVVRMTGVCSLHVLELAQVAAADVAFVGSDPADVVGVLPDQIGVQVVQGPPHLVGVFLIDAEDDGLGEAVGLLEEVGEVLGDGLGSGLQRDDPLEVLGVVIFVGDLPAVAVDVALGWAASRPRPMW